MTFRLIQIEVYAEDGWAGYGRLARDRHDRRHTCVKYRSFKKARAFVRSLGLKSQAEWRDYCKSGKKPA